MSYGDGTHVEIKDPNITAAGELYRDFGMSCVESKDELDYDDLCTLESLLSYLNHEVSLDMEIAMLKEKALLSQCKELKAEIDFMKADDVSCSLKGCNAANDYKHKYADALMLMSYINPEYIPKDRWNHIMLAAADKPSILLNYIDEDTHLSWQVRKTVNGNEVMVDHGLRTKDEDMEDD